MKHSIVSTEELLLFPHLTCAAVRRQREGRKKVFLILHANATNTNANNPLCLGLNNGFGCTLCLWT